MHSAVDTSCMTSLASFIIAVTETTATPTPVRRQDGTMTLEFSATVDGDSMSGDVKLGAFGNATFTGTRA